MRICAVQLRLASGDFATNSAKHLEFIKLASAHRADVVFFPELSLTGYDALPCRGEEARHVRDHGELCWAER